MFLIAAVVVVLAFIIATGFAEAMAEREEKRPPTLECANYRLADLILSRVLSAINRLRAGWMNQFPHLLAGVGLDRAIVELAPSL